MENQPLIFAPLAQTPENIWVVLSNFIERWYAFDIPIFDCEQDVQELEKSLNITFPASFREYYTLCRRILSIDMDSSEEVSFFHTIFGDTLRIEQMIGVEATLIMMNNNMDFYWAYQHAELAQPNPAIHGYDFNMDNQIFTYYKKIFPSIASFTLHQVVSNLYMGNVGGFALETKDKTTATTLLKNFFTHQYTFEGFEIFESPEGFAFLSKHPYREDELSYYVCLHLWKEIPKKTLSKHKTLPDLVQQSFNPYGIFSIS